MNKYADILFAIAGTLLLVLPWLSYIACIVIGIKFFILPLITLYGFWAWLGGTMGLSIASFASVYLGIFTYAKYKEVNYDA